MAAPTAPVPEAPTADQPTASETTLPAIMLRRARETPDRVALRKKHLGIWKQYTWSDYAERAAAVGLGLRALGVEAGDRVAVHSLNRPAWALADMGIQGIGAIAVGIYPTCPAAEVEYLLSHSETKVLVAEDEEQVDKALEVLGALPALQRIVVVDTRGVDMSHPLLMSFAELEELGRSAGTLDDYAALVREVDPSRAAIIVYTSGTTGPPKGAMLSHDNLLAASRHGATVFSLTPDDEILSYLPLCHIAERLISVINAIGLGYVVNFGDGVDELTHDLREVQPTFFLGVPRVWEKLMAGITIRIGDAGLLKRLNYRFWMARGARLARRRWSGGLGPLGTVQYALGWLLLYRSLRDKIGLGRARFALSGAAPVAPQVLEFFWALGVPVLEGYGMTENTAQGTITPRDDVRLGKVGLPVPECELRIADDGEILTRGPGTFLGYFRDPEATAEAIDADGWLHTGDIGELDEDGYLRITDRKKDLIVTAGGKNVAPQPIENEIKNSLYILEAVMLGDRRPYPIVLVVPNFDQLASWARQQGISAQSPAELVGDERVRRKIESEVERRLTGFARYEIPKKVGILEREFTIEAGELTPTMKVKRRVVEERYRDVVEALYGTPEAVPAE